jgi:hypothetical protein
MSDSQNAASAPKAARKSKKVGMVYLLIGIPLTSVLLGVVTLYFAFTSTDRDVRLQDAAPMSKTSWQEVVDDR